jgi:hypothetical protein
MSKGPIIISLPRLTWLILLGLVGFLAGGGASVQAQQFSADLVRNGLPGGAAASFAKLRVFNDKVRIETSDFPDGFFLIDGVSRAAYFARPGQRVFMDARQSSRLTQLFVPLDLGDPCLQWQAMAELAGATEPSDRWRCERVGGRSWSTAAVPWSTGRDHPLVGTSLAGSIRTSNSRCESNCKTARQSRLRTFARNHSPHPCSRFRRASGNSIRRPSSSGSSKAMCGSTSRRHDASLAPAFPFQEPICRLARNTKDRRCHKIIIKWSGLLRGSISVRCQGYD